MSQTSLRSKSKYSLDPSGSYVIAGGFGGLGRSAARWMVAKGAKKLILLSRSGPISKAAMDLVHELVNRGVQLETPKCDVTDVKSLTKALSQSEELLGPIRGCLQATMVLNVRSCFFLKILALIIPLGCPFREYVIRSMEPDGPV
jgi:NAD(P)-dependent dehydrogenase (short-subunit alcohol dehydrogenase family)